MPRLKRYQDEVKGVPLQDIWVDIKLMHNISAERTGYPTQKPEALLDRIIKSSSDQGELVLDCFCRLRHYGGCSRKAKPTLDRLRPWPLRHPHHAQAASANP